MSDVITHNQNISNKTFWQNTKFLLLCVILFAAGLRVINLGKSPPGLNQDEAANIWNAYCLLKTGKDQVGVSWPIFYMHALGTNRTALYIYALIPFLAVGGLSIPATRMLSAVSGIICIPVIYYIGSRLFNKKTGLVAAALLAVNPWHLFISRWAHESAIAPVLGITPLALLLWAGLPITDDSFQKPRPIRAAIAGLVTGISCYAYWCVPIFILLFLVLAVLLRLPALFKCLKTKSGILSITLFIVGISITFGPLLWQYIFNPEGVAYHGKPNLYWAGSDPVGTVIKNISKNYISYFGLDFLFIRGDQVIVQSPPDMGQFHWYMLPLFLSGLIFIVTKLRASAAARLLFAMVLIYPVAGSIGRTEGPHALRSSSGLCALVLLAAVGAYNSFLWLRKKSLLASIIAVAVFSIAFVGLNSRYLYRFYGEFNRRTDIFLLYRTDLAQACQWLSGRQAQFEAVFCTTKIMNMPYIISLVTLKYDPNKWLNEPRYFKRIKEYDYYYCYGKMHFMYDESFVPVLEKLRQKPARKPILFIIRPGELNLANPIYKISIPSGEETLWLCVI